jgi:hypothetical protein
MVRCLEQDMLRSCMFLDSVSPNISSFWLRVLSRYSVKPECTAGCKNCTGVWNVVGHEAGQEKGKEESVGGGREIGGE